MKFKMRVLHYSPDGNAEAIADAVARDQKCNSDKIPPAYPVENEKLTFIGFEGAKPHKSVTALVTDFTSSRTKNVALYGVGSNQAALDEIKAILSTKDINVVGMHLCQPSGGGLFKKKLSDADIKGVVDWAAKIVDAM